MTFNLDDVRACGERRISFKFFAQVITAAVLATSPAGAQNVSGSGQNWSGGWGFQSPADRATSLQAAQAIRAARTQPGPGTVVNTTNNVRNVTNSNIVEYVGSEGQDLSTTIIVGDAIDQNTNSIGAMNTGQTEIRIDGNNNAVNATNAADSNGCVDGSITNSQFANTVDPGSFTGSTVPGLSALSAVRYVGPSSTMKCQ